MKIEVLGPGCAKCNMLEENTRAAVKNLGLDCPVEKVTSLADISSRGVMMTPALAVDGEVKSSGKLLSQQDIEKLFQG